MRANLGLTDPGLDRLVRGAFGLLHLITFFTADQNKAAQSWHLRQGFPVWHANSFGAWSWPGAYRSTPRSGPPGSRTEMITHPRSQPRPSASRVARDHTRVCAAAAPPSTPAQPDVGTPRPAPLTDRQLI